MIAKGELWSLILGCAKSIWPDGLSWWFFFDAPPVYLFLLHLASCMYKSTKGPVEPGTLSAMEPYVLEIFAMCTNVFCMLHGTYPHKGQENRVHTSHVERYLCVQITKMWFVCCTYHKEWPYPPLGLLAYHLPLVELLLYQSLVWGCSFFIFFVMFNICQLAVPLYLITYTIIVIYAVGCASLLNKVHHHSYISSWPAYPSSSVFPLWFAHCLKLIPLFLSLLPFPWASSCCVSLWKSGQLDLQKNFSRASSMFMLNI